MRVFPADSISGKESSMDAIPSSYLEDGDFCMTKVNDTIFMYHLNMESGEAIDVPYRVAPKYVWSGEETDPVKRWELCDLSCETIISRSSKTDRLTSLFEPYIMVESDLYVSRLITDNTEMVQNLNVEYLGGVRYDQYVKGEYPANTLAVPTGVDEMTVNLPRELTNNEYTIVPALTNNIDASPSIYAMLISDQTTTSFKVRFSGLIDSANYRLNYIITGDIVV